MDAANNSTLQKVIAENYKKNTVENFAKISIA
jgi:hypothetical protein